MATIVRWNPLRELERMTADLGWPRVAPSAFSPSLDVLERDGKLHIRVDAPGVAKEDLHVEVNGGRLTISGERKARRPPRAIASGTSSGRSAASAAR